MIMSSLPKVRIMRSTRMASKRRNLFPNLMKKLGLKDGRLTPMMETSWGKILKLTRLIEVHNITHANTKDPDDHCITLHSIFY